MQTGTFSLALKFRTYSPFRKGNHRSVPEYNKNEGFNETGLTCSV